MIKFFRHIRKSLISENKMGIYFKYAIGEILLVVIGILIALQINTWNEERKERNREQAILKNLQLEYNSNIGNVADAYNSFYEAYEASDKLLEIVASEDAINPQEVDALLDVIINKTKSLDIITGTLDEIVSTGSLNLITDENLRKQLSNWSFFITDTQDDIVIYRDYLFGVFIPEITDKVNLKNLPIPDFFDKNLGFKPIPKSNFKIDYNKTIRTVEFENQLYNNTLNYMYVLNSYKAFKDYLSGTLELIDGNIR
ncbi:DUF6090 family protein [Winogradskyella vincentii]|uniref:Uncharacterized protein n=1 Tax=Winogradskyella vincentii TaxID=2877122 RepID=A0ABS7Y480_9FLAO|nr:DUF6090 family protein [Winogradskyella vincentii]MCA0154401.1 hypothetical protein [Winogradskyella vincentii]